MAAYVGWCGPLPWSAPHVKPKPGREPVTLITVSKNRKGGTELLFTFSLDWDYQHYSGTGSTQPNSRGVPGMFPRKAPMPGRGGWAQGPLIWLQV